jgi:hypothetical protein
MTVEQTLGDTGALLPRFRRHHRRADIALTGGTLFR